VSIDNVSSNFSGIVISMSPMDGIPYKWSLAAGFWQLAKPIRATFKKSQRPAARGQSPVAGNSG
jgi:hypothetical protein